MRFADLLIAHDLTPGGDLLLAALQRRELDAGRVHLVHVLPRVDPTYASLVWRREDDALRRRTAESKLRAAVGDGPWARATVHVEIGDPATRIVALAGALGSDLIAIGTHGRRGVDHLLLGSVAEHVVRFAPCPVMVLPAAVTAAEAPPPAVAPPEGEVDDRVAQVGAEVCDLLGRRPGTLTALRIGLPDGTDRVRFEDGLLRWLAEAGVSFVDLAFTRTAGARPEVLGARFEQRDVAP